MQIQRESLYCNDLVFIGSSKIEIEELDTSYMTHRVNRQGVGVKSRVKAVKPANFSHTFQECSFRNHSRPAFSWKHATDIYPCSSKSVRRIFASFLVISSWNLVIICKSFCQMTDISYDASERACSKPES